MHLMMVTYGCRLSNQLAQGLVEDRVVRINLSLNGDHWRIGWLRVDWIAFVDRGKRGANR